MSDPAVRAAQQAWASIPYNDAPFDPEGDPEAAELVSAAREMAKPLRELHRLMTPSELADAGLSPDWRKCWECSSGYYWRDWPCESAEHLYTTEELTR